MSATRRTTAKPSISVIGAGRLGHALAIALSKSGYSILALVSKREAHAKQALRTISKENPEAIALGGSNLEKLPPSDLIILSTPDDAISEIAERLAKPRRGKTRGRTVLHTSGALSSAVLAPLAEAGFHTGSIHPLVSSSEPENGAKAFRGAFFCLEGDRYARRVAAQLVKDLKGQSFSIPSQHKALYHAAAVMASPHLVALFDLAIEILAGAGLGKRRAREVLLPLVETTLDNLKLYEPGKALTGTYARGDVATVAKHLNALSKTKLSGKLSNADEIYRLLGLHSLTLAKGNRLDPKVVNQIKKLLAPR